MKSFPCADTQVKDCGERTSLTEEQQEAGVAAVFCVSHRDPI